MADQVISLGFSIDTTPLGAAAVASEKVANNVGKAADAAKRGQGNFQGLGMGVLYASQAFEDMQYGVRAVLNNIPLLITAIGGGAGLAGAVSLAAVAGNLLYENYSKLSPVFKDTASEMENVANQAKRMADSLQGPGLQKFVEDTQRGLQALKDIGEGFGTNPQQGQAVAGVLRNEVPGSVRDQLVIAEAQRLIEASPEVARAREIVDTFERNKGVGALGNKQVEEARKNLQAVETATSRTASERIGRLIDRAKAGDPEAIAQLQTTLQGIGLGDVAAQLDTAMAAPTEQVQQQQDAAALAEDIKRKRNIEKGFAEENVKRLDREAKDAREQEVEQLQERLRWERVAFQLKQDQENRRKALQDAELKRMDTRPFLERAVDNLVGGGLNAQGVAQALRMRRLMGMNDIEAQVSLKEELAGNLFAAGQAGMGPMLNPFEARAQARRLIQDALPEANFFGQQIERQMQAMGPLAQFTERLAVAQEKLLNRGVPMFLRKGPRQ